MSSIVVVVDPNVLFISDIFLALLTENRDFLLAFVIATFSLEIINTKYRGLEKILLKVQPFNLI